MNLKLDPAIGCRYTNTSQIVRVMTEHWCANNLSCPVCGHHKISQNQNNTPAVDFNCRECKSNYQLKSRKLWNNSTITDAGYEAMIKSIKGNSRPHLLIMGYTTDSYVYNLMLIPYFFFSETCIQKRKPLSPNAKRANWVGCNIKLDLIAPEGKIMIVENGNEIPNSKIMHQYSRITGIAEFPLESRGWLLDVFHLTSQYGNREFTLREMYSHEAYLAALHPDNKHIKDKIRQQLQYLRDQNLIEFLGRGVYKRRIE